MKLRTMTALLFAVLLMETLWCAAFTSPEALRGLLWREAQSSATMLGPRTAQAAAAFERGAYRLVTTVFWPERGEWVSERRPGMLPAGVDARTESGRIFSKVLARTASAPYVENLRLTGLLALKRLGRAAAVFLAALLLILHLAADGFCIRRIRTSELRAPRPSVFSGLGTLMLPGAAFTIGLATAPAALPFWLWAALPVIFGLVVRGLFANWHRFG